MDFNVSGIITAFRNRPVYDLGRDKFLAEKRNFLWAGAVIYIIALVLRSWENFIYPGLYVEDATYYFKMNYHAGFSIAAIFRNPNGYYNIFNNFISQVIGNFDVSLQPIMYQTVATVLSVITVVGFSRTGLVKNRFLLLITPLFLGLSGLNHIFYYTTITFQMYVLVITLFLVLLWDRQAALKNNILIYILIPILVWSGPYSVLAVPFAVVFMVLFRGKNGIMVWTIFVVVCYLLSTTGGKGTGIVPSHLFSSFYQELWFNIVVGNVFYMGLNGDANIEKALLLVIVIGPLIYLIRRESFHLRILLLLMTVIICTPAPLLISNKFLLYQGVYPCHVLTAQICWILFLLILTDRVLMQIPLSYKKCTGIAVAGAMLVLVVWDNYVHEDKGKYPIQKNLPEFFKTVKKYESRHAELKEKNENIAVVVDVPDIFDPIVVFGSSEPDATMVERVVVPPPRSK